MSGSHFVTVEWHVQHRVGTTEHVNLYPSPEVAIEAACRLIDAGHEVHGIGTGPLTDSIGPIEIARIYDMWRRTSRKPGTPFLLSAANVNRLGESSAPPVTPVFSNTNSEPRITNSGRRSNNYSGT